MSIASVLASLDFSVGMEKEKELKKKTTSLVSLLTKELARKKIKGGVFVGGSFAKGTLMRQETYDVDIFVRFLPMKKNMSLVLEQVVLGISKQMGKQMIRIHGSRDYFSIVDGEVHFEIIPVLKIRKSGEMENVTDLSYFHVKYVTKKINRAIQREIVLAKAFCAAAGVYGAESYIQGFSGYALECLLIHYKRFKTFLEKMSKIEEQVIIDPMKQYSSINEVKLQMNEARLKGPLVVVDPTNRERNVTAALSWESFFKFQQVARAFLKKPAVSYFTPTKRILKAGRGTQHLRIHLSTDRQAGDIAGTKLSKFFRYLAREIEKHYQLIDKDFEYGGGADALGELLVKAKEEVLRKGPPVSMVEAVASFKKKHRTTIVKEGVLYARMEPPGDGKEWLRRWIAHTKSVIGAMGITDVRVL